MNKFVNSLILLLLFCAIAESADKGLLVLANGRIRKEASKTGETVQGVVKGDTLICGESKEGWYQVLDKSGAEVGWIAASVVKTVEIAAPVQAMETKKDTLAAVASPASPAALPVPDTAKPPEKKDSVTVAKKDSVMAPQPAERHPGKISLLSNAKLRAKPASDGAVVKGLTKGEKLDFTGEEAGWFRILNTDGTEAGFVSKTVAEVVTPPETSGVAAAPVQVPKDTLVAAMVPSLPEKPQGVMDSTGKILHPGRLVTTSNARVRAEPSTTAAVVFGVKLGDTLKYSNEESGFFRIVNDSLVTQGFISNTVVQTITKPETLVVASKDTAKPDTAIIAKTDSSLGRADSTLVKADSLAGAALKPDSAVKDAVAQKPAEGKKTFRERFDDVKASIVAYVKSHRRQTIIAGSSTAGLLILVIALSGGSSNAGGNPGGNPGVNPTGRTEIPAINIPPPPDQ